VTERHEDLTDADLAALVERFSRGRTYRPTDGQDEPCEMPQGPSGTAPATSVPDGSGGDATSVPDGCGGDGPQDA
jgi:hypothetical protein